MSVRRAERIIIAAIESLQHYAGSASDDIASWITVRIILTYA